MVLSKSPAPSPAETGNYGNTGNLGKETYFTDFTAITTFGGYGRHPLTIRELDQLYFKHRGKAGWLADLTESFELSPENVAYLEQLDDVAGLSKDQQDDIREMDKEWAWGILGKSEQKSIKILKANLKKIYRKYQEMTLTYRPFCERDFILAVNEAEDKERFLRSLIGKTKQKPSSPHGTRITQEDIERARAVDLASLVEPDRTGRIICPFHPDKKPSMWIRNGFGYCFSCGQHCDSIRWLSEVESLGFIEAVRRLAR